MTAATRGLLLLDTHVWLWLISGASDRASRRTWRTLERAARADGLRVSIISVWEAAVLEARGRIRLAPDCHTWAARALAAPGLHLEPISPTIAVESTRLPAFPHRDPADQLLVATARVTGATLVTRDRRLLDYAAGGYVAAWDATPGM
jgi:PIN domain nuclease of toxin-antitoxin system